MTEAIRPLSHEDGPTFRSPVDIEAEIRDLTRGKVSQDLKWMRQLGTHLQDGTQLIIVYTEDSPRDVASEFVVRKLYPGYNRRTNPHAEEYRWPAGDYRSIADDKTLKSINELLDLLETNMPPERQEQDG